MTKIAIFSAHKFEIETLNKYNSNNYELKLIETYLNKDTAILADGCQVVSLFVNDDASAPVLEKLHKLGVQYIALRSAGFNHVDLEKAKELGIGVGRVPDYSPYAIAEHTVALMLALNRKLVRANSRVRELNFTLDGLIGFDMHGKTVGVLGTGKIGAIVAKILHGFGCRLLGFDLYPDQTLKEKYGMEYTTIDHLVEASDIISLHIPLNDHTRYIINEDRIRNMKKGVMLINTSRGGLVNTKHVIDGLKNGQIGYLGLDVYEEEKGLFFEDHSTDILQDDVIARLMTFSNVLITSHQAFLTENALGNISQTTFENIRRWEANEGNPNNL